MFAPLRYLLQAGFALAVQDCRGRFGWFDINLKSTLENSNGLQNKGRTPAQGNQKLVMGAIGHMGPVSGAQFPDETGDRFLPQTTVLRWFNYWLKGEQNDVLLEPAVRYYLMGDTFDTAAPGNKWLETTSWPPIAEPRSLYLQVDGSLAEHPSEIDSSCSYVYDPLNPVPTEGGNNLFLDSGPFDQRPVSQRSDVLRFVGPVLEAPLQVVGPISVDLWVSTDAEDTDFIVKLIDIHPNGYESLVRDQGLRLRYRSGMETQERVEPGKIYPIVVDLWSTALVFNTGHRIGLLIQSSNWPRFERHTNTWEPVASYGEAVQANNQVHVGLEHHSRLVLPIVDRCL